MTNSPAPIAAVKRRPLSLRQRFLVAPLLGLVLICSLMVGFIYELQRQSTLLTNVVETRLAAFDHYAEVFMGLTDRQMALDDLLDNAATLHEEAVYVQAKDHLNAIHAAISKIGGFFDGVDRSLGNDEAFKAQQSNLLRITEEYRKAVTYAVEMATVNPGLGPKYAALAGERFGAMNQSFSRLLAMQRRVFATDVEAEIRQTRTNTAYFAFAGIAGASLLLFLSVALSRFLSRALEAQIDTLSQLDGRSEPAQDGDDEMQRIARAIDGFRETQTKLRESEQRFRCLTEMSSDFYWETDSEHRLTIRSESHREALESVFNVASSVGKCRWEIPSLAPDEAGWRAHRAVLDAHLPFREFEISRPRVNGAVHHISVSGDPLFDAAGNFKGYRGVGSDITEQKRSEADLRIAAAAFESQEGMAITNADGIILRVNHAFTEITGYTAEEIVGKTPRVLKSNRHDADFYRSMWESIKSNGGWQGEIWDRRKNGEVYPKWLTISAVKDKQGAVTHFVSAQYDITARKQSEDKINELAFFDQLTGLANRTLLLDRLKQAMTASGRSGCNGALVFLDLDNFKSLNDTLGHDAGDLLLQQVARRLSACVRDGDTVARLGGDEFVVILANLSASDAEAASGAEMVAAKLLDALNMEYRFGDVAHHSTASIGATLFKGSLLSTDELMKQSDLAMYKAKSAGRNAVRFFDPAMEVTVKERSALESDLRHALHEKHFALHYQAQVAGERQVIGAEVLVRWMHPQRGMVLPDNFIPLAEETGLILPLGCWVLETACTQLAKWAVQPDMAHLTLAVNVSPSQFRQPDFVDQVLTVLAATQANPRRLKLELTENLLVQNIEDIIEKMTALKARGVGFALDDFGIGYSSLSYLKRLPLGQLKIDRSFVRDVLTDPNDAAIAKTVIALAQTLGLSVIAEGVETAAQREFLARSGCQDYQGYFFSRPLPIEGFEAFARRDAIPTRSAGKDTADSTGGCNPLETA